MIDGCERDDRVKMRIGMREKGVDWASVQLRHSGKMNMKDVGIVNDCAGGGYKGGIDGLPD